MSLDRELRKNEKYFRDRPVFNLSLSLEEFKGPYKNLIEFRVYGSRVLQLKALEGNFHVLGNGEIRPGFKEGLHTYEGKFDLGLSSHRIILNSGLEGDIRKLEIIPGKKFPFKLEQGSSYPVYTLGGIYSKVKKKTSKEEKIRVLSASLERLTGYDSHSVVNSEKISENSKLEILENNYKRLVSNQ